MKKTLIIFFILTIINCRKNNDHKDAKKNNITHTMKEDKTKLIDGIVLNNSFFNKNEITLKKYSYNGIFIEDIKINDLLNTEFRQNFFLYLNSRENEDDFKATLFTRLLMLRIKQLKDTDAFFLLIQSSKDESISNDGIELLSDYIVELFLPEVSFFVKQSYKYKDVTLINYIMNLMNDFLIKEKFFQENLGSVNLKKGMLLLDPKKEEEFTNEELILKLNYSPKIEVIFSPSLYTEWQNETLYFKNIKLFFNEDLNFTEAEKDFYKKNIVPKLNDFYIRNFHIQDSEGYVNLRQNPNNTSPIIAKVNNGKYACFIEEEGDWVLVEILDAGLGYIHKSRLKF